MFKKGELPLLWPFYLSKCIQYGLSLISSYFIIYFMGRGLSLFQISMLISLPTLIGVLFDIPTGAVADIYGRKVSVVLSFLLGGIFMILVPFIQDFWYLLLLFVLWGITDTLASGAYEAWVISNLHDKKKSSLIGTYFSHDLSIANIGVVLSPLLAALIVTHFQIYWLFVLHGIGIIVGALVLFLAPEKFTRKKVEFKKLFRNTLKFSRESITYGLKHLVLFKLLMAFLFLMLVVNASGFLWQPYLKEFQIPLPYFGYVTAVAGLLSILVPLLTHYFSRKFTSTSKYLALLIFGLIAVLLLAYWIKSPLIAMGLVVIIYVAIMFVTPVENTFFQKFVPHRMRATIGSFKSTTGRLGVGLATLGVGALADWFGVRNSLAALAILLLPSLYYYLKIQRLGH